MAAVYRFSRPSFVPSPVRRGAAVAVPAVAAAGAAAPAFADAMGDAAKRLSEEAYPFMKEVNWNSYLISPDLGPHLLAIGRRPSTKRSSWAPRWTQSS